MGGGLRTANVKYLMESTNAVEAHGTSKQVAHHHPLPSTPYHCFPVRKVVESSMEYRPSPVVHMGSEKVRAPFRCVTPPCTFDSQYIEQMLDDTTEFQWREATPATVEAFVKAAQSADISK